ncbi:uncharacterized protein MKZ38_007106 [Zalerion maritima]|uniref:mitogen-activated protein kinase n=1 Tax=Zalerion maritima TaxID=339359 RepID=A0AAD5WNF3_9PEZI|nr:uncharacterized protein MKZ38_007106 [Zalerion maritima]
MASEVSPRAVRFHTNEDEPRTDKPRRGQAHGGGSEDSSSSDDVVRPQTTERYSDHATMTRYDSTAHPNVPTLITSSNSLATRQPNGTATRTGRPGITRTPSSTYQPQRGPPPPPPAHAKRSDSVTRRGLRQRSTIKSSEVDPLYIAKMRSEGHDSYFASEGDYESDSEGETPSSEGPFSDQYDGEGILFSNIFENNEPTDEDLEDPSMRGRLEWYGMLQTVLTGDVVRQEKKRLIGTSGMEDIKTPQYAEELWLGVKAKSCGRTLAVQRKMVEDARSSLDGSIDIITGFKVTGTIQAGGKSHVEQMMDVRARIEKAESLYPSLKALAESHTSIHSSFWESYEAIMAWHNTSNIINTQLQILRRWVGNESLDFKQTKPLSPSANGIGDESSFLDRILKEDGLKSFHDEEEPEKEEKVQDKKKIRTKPMLPCITEVVWKVKEATVEFHEAFDKRHFPSYDEDLLLLLTFPTRLIEDIIKVRLAYAKKVKESAQQNTLMQDQMIGQFQLLLKLAIKIKGEYNVLSKTEPGWELAAPLDDSYDQVVLDALKYYFKMLNWKLSSNKNTFKEAELLFQEWEFVNEVGNHLQRGPINVAEHFSSLTHKALSRLSQTFSKELERKPKESGLDISKRYKQVLDSVRVRQRMLQRFSRMLSTNYENACDFLLANTRIEDLYDALIEGGHFQLYTGNVEHDNIFLLASPSLWGQEDVISRIITVASEGDMISDLSDPYILVMRPETRFVWYGEKMEVSLREESIDLKIGHGRLIAGGSGHRLVNARRAFLERLGFPLDLVVEQRSNFTKVNTKMTQIRTVAYKLSNSFMESVEYVRKQTMGLDCQELIQTCFVFATEFGQRSLLIMDSNKRQMNNMKLTKLALDWVSFICDNCVASDRRTFRWAVLALEFALGMTRGRQIIALTSEEYDQLRSKVSGCMSILISHFDIMGARSMLAAKAERDKQRIDALMSHFRRMDENRVLDDHESSKLVSEGRLEKLGEVEEARGEILCDRQALGRVLEVSNEIDRSLMFLSSAASNNQIALRWQLGHFVGGGTFGNVYSAMNLDTGQLMAVKEIRLQDPKQIPQIAAQIKEEMAVLEVLNHPNVVSYFGLEVHRDRVYIFMEFCSGGSLASLLEHGRIEDESVIMVYALQLLEGLAYLHASNISHRDIKPENILLDHNGVIKYVDFGAAKVIARQGKTLVSSLASTKANKSMTGTPMYMSPEVIKGENPGRAGAVDVWSLGCVILEMATGRRPWANLDNEWAIMYNIAQGNPPQLPAPDQLSPQGIDFLKRCFAKDPRKRATAEQLLQHEWIMSIRNQVIEPPTPSDSGQSSLSTPSVTPSSNALTSSGGLRTGDFPIQQIQQGSYMNGTINGN